jgi:hypothetical protein
MGYLEDNATSSVVALIVLFTDIEAYLRKTLPLFCTNNSLDQKTMGQAAGITKEPGKHLSLGDLLATYSKVIETIGAVEYKDLVGGWQELAALRNLPAHGDYTLQKWRSIWDAHGNYREQGLIALAQGQTGCPKVQILGLRPRFFASQSRNLGTKTVISCSDSTANEGSKTRHKSVSDVLAFHLRAARTAAWRMRSHPTFTLFAGASEIHSRDDDHVVLLKAD